MKIAFWSPMHGTGATANMLAVTLAVAAGHDRSILMAQTHYNMNDLEGPLIGGIEGAGDEHFFVNMGVDALVKYFKAGILSREIIESCSIGVSENVALLAGTRQNSEAAFDDAMMKRIMRHVLDKAEEFYDWVVVDTNSGYSDLGFETVKRADVVVVTLRQNRSMLDDLFKNENFLSLDRSKIFYLFGNYDYKSKYNLHNLRRLYKPIKIHNSGGLPHSTSFMDAIIDRRACRYIEANMVAEDYGEELFFNSLEEVSRKIKALAGRR